MPSQSKIRNVVDHDQLGPNLDRQSVRAPTNEAFDRRGARNASRNAQRPVVQQGAVVEAVDVQAERVVAEDVPYPIGRDVHLGPCSRR